MFQKEKEFEPYSIKADLFYTIYEYLCKTRPEKWNFIHSVDDFNFMLPEEVKDLAKDAVEWLKIFLPELSNVDYDDYKTKSTLFYMTLSYMAEFKIAQSFYTMDSNSRNDMGEQTIAWLTNCIDDIE